MIVGHHETDGFAFDSPTEDNAHVYRHIRLSAHGDALSSKHLVPVAEIDGPEFLVVEIDK